MAVTVATAWAPPAPAAVMSEGTVVDRPSPKTAQPVSASGVLFPMTPRVSPAVARRAPARTTVGAPKAAVSRSPVIRRAAMAALYSANAVALAAVGAPRVCRCTAAQSAAAPSPSRLAAASAARSQSFPGDESRGSFPAPARIAGRSAPLRLRVTGTAATATPARRTPVAVKSVLCGAWAVRAARAALARAPREYAA